MSTIKINSGSGTPVSINEPGQPGVPIERPVSARVCDYLYDAIAAFSENTDTYNTGVIHAAEMFGFKNNMQLTCNLNAGSSIPQIATGKIKFGVYFPSDEWVRPGTSVMSDIYDYTASVWSATGAAYYGNGVVEGAAKPTNYPNHGQEMYDLTGGALGFDFVNGVAGASGASEFFDMVDILRDYCVDKFGRHLSSGSYRFGEYDYYPMLLQYFLGLRNSTFPELGQDGDSNYGKSKDQYNYLGLPQQEATRLNKITAPSTVRYTDMAGTSLQRSAYAAEKAALAITNRGHYNNFIHWHNVSNYDTLDGYWGTINTAIGSNFVWRCSYGEAVEYLMLRELVSGIVVNRSGNSVIINVSSTDPFNGLTHGGFSQAIPQDLITVPISIRINLRGTFLDGEDISVSAGSIRKISDNVFVLQIPFTPNVGFTSVTVSSTESPNYLNFALPAITSSSNNGTTLQVNTDINTKAVLYRVATGGAAKDSIAHARSSTFATTHNFDISALSNQDYRVGVISQTDQSILSGII